MRLDLLGAGLERIGKQRSNRHGAPPIGTHSVAETGVIGHLLVEIAANACRQTRGKVLIEGPFKMQLDATLVVRHGIECIKCHAKRARDFGSRLLTEESIGPFDVEGGPI